MIQKVFLDTNVIVDLIINRDPFAQQAEEIFSLKDSYNYEVFISALSIANLAYSIDRLNKKPHAAIAKLLPLVRIVDLTAPIIGEAVLSTFEDFEDGLQHYSAVAAKSDVIV